MNRCFINSAVAISAQNTFENPEFLSEVIPQTTKTVEALHPNYKNSIAPSASRRMAIGVKMGVAAAKKALKIATLETPDAISTGTGMGCIEDTEKFLNTILTNKETFITPTAFIQSTHNTVGAQIALGLQCKAYNNTYVHGSVSFESALLDAQLMIQEAEAKNILVGGVDELGKEFIDYVQMLEAQQKQGIKVPFSEGASFFVVSSEQQKNSYAEVLDVAIFSTISEEEIHQKMFDFLKNNKLSVEKIDAVVLGNNGDAFDSYYKKLQIELFSETPQIHYKQLSGEYYTASAFGFWVASKILKGKKIPKILLQNKIEKSEYKTILLYNQFKGKQHSFILLKQC